MPELCQLVSDSIAAGLLLAFIGPLLGIAIGLLLPRNARARESKSEGRT